MQTVERYRYKVWGAKHDPEDQEIALHRAMALTETIQVLKKQTRDKLRRDRVGGPEYSAEKRRCLDALAIYLDHPSKRKPEFQCIKHLVAQAADYDFFDLLDGIACLKEHLIGLTEPELQHLFALEPQERSMWLEDELVDISVTRQELRSLDKHFGTKKGQYSLFDRTLASLMLTRNAMDRKIDYFFSERPCTLYSTAYKAKNFCQTCPGRWITVEVEEKKDNQILKKQVYFKHDEHDMTMVYCRINEETPS